MAIPCKRCAATSQVKNGFVRGHQRYKCKACGYNFIEGDRRVDPQLAGKKALAVILYSVGRASFGLLARIFGHSRTLMYQWIVEAAATVAEPTIAGDITEMEFDEMWHFLVSKKQTLALQGRGSSHTAHRGLGGR